MGSTRARRSLPTSLFAFPTPACPGAQHRSNHGGALGSFLTSARRCPPPPRRQITPRLFFSFLFFLSLRCCFATSCCLLPPPFFRLSLFRSLHQPHPPNRASVRFLFRRGRPHLGPIRCCCAGRVLPPFLAFVWHSLALVSRNPAVAASGFSPVALSREIDWGLGFLPALSWVSRCSDFRRRANKPAGCFWALRPRGWRRSA